jgi:hypothetical protein
VSRPAPDDSLGAANVLGRLRSCQRPAGAVKGDVVRDLRAPVPVRGGRAHRVELALEWRDLSIDQSRSLACRHVLEGCAHGKDGQELRVVHRPDTGSADRLGLDEP